MYSMSDMYGWGKIDRGKKFWRNNKTVVKSLTNKFKPLIIEIWLTVN